ncbi:hypothetical protein DY000_02052613 [Brassica cretica]|uniref:Uncharacterized protein n=1 Tax=Brassica cretica TaxID=69181 RepID=A0ABQ7AKU1_BRACR|nr:hypothetical protein DY000_02052613 [Brassica cretica]
MVVMSLKTEEVRRGGGAIRLSAHRRVKKTKDVRRDCDAVDEDDDVMRRMMIQLTFRV